MSEEAIALLKSIDRSLKMILAVTEAPARSGAAEDPVASDSDLDGKYGNPTLKSIPARYTAKIGESSLVGKKYSELPPDLLDAEAGRRKHYAEQADRDNELTSGGKPKAPYLYADAARARGWAKRIRNGWKPAPKPSFDDAGFGPAEPLDDSEIPF